MKFLIINQYAGSPEHGMEFRPHWMARKLIELGHEVLIVAGNHSHLRLSPLKFGRQSVQGVQYDVLHTIKYKKNGLFRLLNILSFYAQLLMKKRRYAKWNPNYVIASSTHLFDIPPSIQISKLSRAKFIFELHDMWPLSLLEIGHFSSNHPFITLLRKLESLAYQKADLVISLLSDTREYAIRKGLHPDNWIWIPNGIDLHGIKSDAPPEVLRQLVAFRKRFKKIIIYAGQFGNANSLDDLIDNAPFALEQGFGIVLIGQGPMKDLLLKKTRDYQNILWLPHVKQTSIQNVLQQADIAYIGFYDSPLYDFGISPNKLFEYMDAGLPVIASIRSNFFIGAEIFAGWKIDPGDHVALQNLICKLSKTSHGEIRDIGQYGRLYARMNFSTDKLIRALIEKLRVLSD